MINLLPLLCFFLSVSILWCFCFNWIFFYPSASFVSQTSIPSPAVRPYRYRLLTRPPGGVRPKVTNLSVFKKEWLLSRNFIRGICCTFFKKKIWGKIWFRISAECFVCYHCFVLYLGQRQTVSSGSSFLCVWMKMRRLSSGKLLFAAVSWWFGSSGRVACVWKVHLRTYHEGPERE
jgi:hypothetical protein